MELRRSELRALAVRGPRKSVPEHQGGSARRIEKLAEPNSLSRPANRVAAAAGRKIAFVRKLGYLSIKVSIAGRRARHWSRADSFP